MKNFSGLGLGLSVVFGCLLLALIAELYYLLWWKKKRITDTTSSSSSSSSTSHTKHLFHFILRRKGPASASTSTTTAPDPEKAMPPDKPVLAGDVDSDLMNLPGPPRFLFTIKEETREDLDSDDGRRSRTRSLSDLMDTPLILSPNTLTLTVSNNPLFESTAAESAELARLRSSPPPKFKFLRDAEEKLYRRLVQEAERKRALETRLSLEDYCCSNTAVTNHNNNNVFALVVGSENLPQYPSSGSSSQSQVRPLASSPSAFKLQPQPILY